MKTIVDRILSAPNILTMDSHHDPIRKNFSLAIQNGKIHEIGPKSEIEKKYQTKEKKHQYNFGENYVLMPGLINAHAHLSMNVFRSTVNNLPLNEWLEKAIWPMERKWVSENMIQDGTTLGLVEQIKNGITYYNDMYFYPQISSEIVQSFGLKAQIGVVVAKFITPTSSSEEDCLREENLDFLKRYSQRDHLSCIHSSLAPHAPYTISDDGLKKILKLSIEHNVPIHMHLHESLSEITDIRPIERLENLGVFSDAPRFIAVHMAQINEQDFIILEKNKKKIGIVHCPQSNAKLAVGISPVTDFLKKGFNLGLGTDSSVSNDTLNIFQEAKMALLLSKIQQNSALSFSAYDALKMMTIDGAKCLGMDSFIGSLEEGKCADIIALKLTDPPIHDLCTYLAYHAIHQVEYVWVNGIEKLINSQIQFVQESQVKEISRRWEENIYTSKKNF